jgi:hypothetical protein
MTLGRRWIGTMLVGVGLMLFGVSRLSWEESSSFALIAAGIVLTLPGRFTGKSEP